MVLKFDSISGEFYDDGTTYLQNDPTLPAGGSGLGTYGDLYSEYSNGGLDWQNYETARPSGKYWTFDHDAWKQDQTKLLLDLHSPKFAEFNYDRFVIEAAIESGELTPADLVNVSEEDRFQAFVPFGLLAPAVTGIAGPVPLGTGVEVWQTSDLLKYSDKTLNKGLGFGWRLLFKISAVLTLLTSQRTVDTEEELSELVRWEKGNIIFTPKTIEKIEIDPAPFESPAHIERFIDHFYVTKKDTRKRYGNQRIFEFNVEPNPKKRRKRRHQRRKDERYLQLERQVRAQVGSVKAIHFPGLMDALPQLDVSLSMSAGPQGVKVTSRTRPPKMLKNNKRANDKKTDHSAPYRAILGLITATYGRYTEMVEVYEAIFGNMYIDRDMVLMLQGYPVEVPRGTTMLEIPLFARLQVLDAHSTGQIELRLDWQQAAMNMLANHAIDVIFGLSGRATREVVDSLPQMTLLNKRSLYR